MGNPIWDLAIVAVAMMIGDNLPEDKNEVKAMLREKSGIYDDDETLDYIVDGVYSAKENLGGVNYESK